MYYIKETYTHRDHENFFDDTTSTDGWQKEVYEYARDIADKNNYSFIVDFGCGSGFKLVNNFKEYNTIGIDLPETVEFLQATYPERQWSTMRQVHRDVDVFIASDVIEHMLDPDVLIEYIKACDPKEIIFSTPDRGLITLWGHSDDGPPGNLAHVREWNYHEFHKYITSHFDVVSHMITNIQQCTQLIHCKKKQP